MSACLYCYNREAGEHQLCRQCREDPQARRAFPPKHGGPPHGHTFSRNQLRDRYGRWYFHGETPAYRRRYDYPGEVD